MSKDTSKRDTHYVSKDEHGKRKSSALSPINPMVQCVAIPRDGAHKGGTWHAN